MRSTRALRRRLPLRPFATHEDAVDVRRQGAATWLTLNRPDQRNAVNPELAAALDAATTRFEQDDDAWVAVLTGAGGLLEIAPRSATLIQMSTISPTLTRRLAAAAVMAA